MKKPQTVKRTEMKESRPFDAATLLKEAETSEYREAYRAIEKNLNYRIGVGVRLTPPHPPSFFIEILIYLAPDDGKVDVAVLEKSVSTLRELQARGFKAAFQDDNCISCEAQVSKERLLTECELDKTLMKNIFNN